MYSRNFLYKTRTQNKVRVLRCKQTTALCQLTAWRMRRDCLMTAWWLPDNCMATAWQLPDDCLKTASDNYLSSARQLMTAWLLPDNSLPDFIIRILISCPEVPIFVLTVENRNYALVKLYYAEVSAFKKGLIKCWWFNPSVSTLHTATVLAHCCWLNTYFRTSIHRIT